MSFGLDFIRSLKPCSWRYTGDLDDGVIHFGFIAQEVETLAPHDRYAMVQIGSDHIYRLVLGEFIGPIVKAIQELDEKIRRLEAAEKGPNDTRILGDDQAGHCDPLGHRHDLETHLGDV